MDNVLQDTHTFLKINIFDQPQRVLVRKELTVGKLLEETLREFKQELDMNRKYVLSFNSKPLDNDFPVLELGLTPEDALVLSYELAHVSEPIAKPLVRSEEDVKQTIIGKLPVENIPAAPVLQEIETGVEFYLQEFPAVIGRPKPGEVSSLAIDLSQFKEALTVSRPHAEVTKDGQFYYIEALKIDRPIFVNNLEYARGKKYQLQEGDIIHIGKIRLQFHLR